MRRAVVLALLPLLAACATASPAAVSAPSPSSTSSSLPSAPPSLAMPTTAAPTTAAATTTPVSPDGFPDSAFMVTAPVLVPVSGPGSIEQRACRPADVTAEAATRPVPGGVNGVIRMVGTHCSLHVVHGPTALLGADGKRLAVALDTDATTINPGLNPHWGTAFRDGDGLWGFSWSGSWCGPRPAFVLVPMSDDPVASPHTGPYGDLKVPLSGAVPPCAGTSTSVLRSGLPGGEGNDTIAPWADALQLPPASWSGLHASLVNDSNAVELTLTNTTDTAIPLSPCPNYFLAATYTLVRGTGDEGSFGHLPCAQHPTIAAHDTASYPIPGPDLSSLGTDSAKPRTPIKIEVAIAGVPTASLDNPQ